MKRFLQLHLLTSYPPSNLNRDDLGRPKTAILGGTQRLRISSQSMKRAWRTSDIFSSAMANHVGTRTKRIGVEVMTALLAGGVTEGDAILYAREIAAIFGKLKKDKVKDPKPSKKAAKKGQDDDAETPATAEGTEQSGPDTPESAVEIEQLVHVGPEERAAVDALVNTLISEKRGPKAEELNFLRTSQEAADIALFGRMLAASTRFNVEAAAQVAHAITVHKAVVEDDYFTAVDDLNTGQENVGSSHLGEIEFGSGVFYIYICVDRKLLIENLGGNRELAGRTLKALVECAAKVSPTGKQATFGSRAYASYLQAELGDQQPRTLSAAFLRPVSGTGQESVLDVAIKALGTTQDGMDRAYGACADERYILNVSGADGTMEGMGLFVAKD